MNKILIFCILIITSYSYINNSHSNENITPLDIVDIYKRSMMHWNINYDKLDENKSGAACIPWDNIDKNYLKEGVFIALGYGFNLYDLNIGKKAALEGCERMRKANKIENTCVCEMILFNNEILIKINNE